MHKSGQTPLDVPKSDVAFARTPSLAEDLTIDEDQADGVPSITLVIFSLMLYSSD